MKRWLFLVVCLLPLFSGGAITLDVGDIKLRGDLPFAPRQVIHGYVECKFWVENRSATKSHKVDVELFVNRRAQSFITKTVTVPSQARITFSVFVSANMPYNGRVRAIVDDRAMKESNYSLFNFSSFYKDRVSLLASKSINQDDLQKEIENKHHWSGSDFDDQYQILRSDRLVREWSDNWLAYSSFDGVIVKQSDIEMMSPTVLAAIRQYVELGGSLTVLGSTTFPFKDLRLKNKKSNYYAIGFGRCFIHKKGKLKKSDFDYNVWENWVRGFEFKLERGIEQMNKILPVTKSTSIPVRGFLLFVILFAFIAGPLTVFVLSKIKRKIWLLWVLPLESAITCGLVFFYSYFSEGITPTVQMREITLLDQQQHMASTFGLLGYYCPQRPSKGLVFPVDLELQKVEKNRVFDQSYLIDWTYKQELTKGWISARVPAFFICRRSAIRRERLEWSSRADGTIEVVNGLGADIKKLWFCDAKGFIHVADNIKAGEKRVLKPTRTKSHKNPKDLQEAILEGFMNAQDWVGDSSQEYLIARSYIATFDDSPFMEHGLGKQKVHLKARGTVFGFLSEEIKP